MKQFRIFQKENITKKEAAGLVHEYLKNVLGEKDEDVQIPENLKDIYDCHTCVQHVTQVYFKGIFFPGSDIVFGMNEMLDANNLLEIEERVFNKDKRKPPMTDEARTALAKSEDVNEEEPLYIESEEIKKFNDYLIVDVRMPEDFAGKKSEGAINIPLHKINLNPHIICEDKFKTIIFVCENGTNSKLAADIARKSGYRRVYYSKNK